MDLPDQLCDIYESKLVKGPFPWAECAKARLTDEEHGILTIYLADIAGIASHGQQLARIAEGRRSQFCQLVEQSFADRWPNLYAKVTAEHTPALFVLIMDTERARMLIKQYFSGTNREDHQ
jgi:hypothetical protein